jgi:hypothetical protein
MRDRLPTDWVRDLDGRHDLEAQVEAALRCHGSLRLTTVSTRSFDRLDFQVLAPGERVVEIELKAKLQPLSAFWKSLRPDVVSDDLFVLDELAMRKIVDAGHLGFLLVRDAPTRRWALWSAGDLLVTSKVRTSRVLRKSSVPVAKGKVILDIAEAAYVGPRLAAALEVLVVMAERVDGWWDDVAPWPKIESRVR